MRCFSIVVLLLAGCGARTGFLDVGEEAPRIDAGMPECVEDAMCDDGVACTRDRCEAGRCVVEADDVACEDGLFCTGPGRCDAAMGCVYERPPCADGLECTEDVCDEAARSCENVPDARFCPLSFRCDADMGCVPRALVHVDDALWEVDLPSGDLHFLVRMRTTLSDIALGGDGVVYGTTPSGLNTVDERTGTTRALLSSSDRTVALEVGPDGSIYVGGSRTISRANLERRRLDVVVELPRSRSASGDIAFIGERMLLSAVGGEVGDVLLEVPLDGREPFDVGEIGFDCVWGLAAFDTTLYGFTCNGELLLIDTESGEGEAIADLEGLRVGGAAAR